MKRLWTGMIWLAATRIECREADIHEVRYQVLGLCDSILRTPTFSAKMRITGCTPGSLLNAVQSRRAGLLNVVVPLQLATGCTR